MRPSSEELIKLYQEKKATEIAEIYNVSRQAIYLWVRKLGIHKKKKKKKKSYPEMICPHCKKITKLKFDPLQEWEKKHLGAKCSFCKKYLFDK